MSYLVLCPTCGGKMSVNARVCPHCGDRGFIVPETAMLPSPCDYRDYGTYALGCEGKGFLCRKQIWGGVGIHPGPLLAGHGSPRPVLIRPGSGRALCPNERQRSAREDRPSSSPERRIRQISGIQRRLRTRTLRGEGALSPVQRDGQGGGRAGNGQLHRHPQASVSRHGRQRTKRHCI